MYYNDFVRWRNLKDSTGDRVALLVPATFEDVI